MTLKRWMAIGPGLFKVLSHRNFALYAALVELQKDHQKTGRVGTRKEIAELIGRPSTVYRGVRDLVRLNYLRIDGDGVVYVLDI